MTMVALVGAGIEVVDGMHAGQSSWVSRMSADAGPLPEFDVIHRWLTITPPSRCAALGMVELELVGLLGKALTRDATRRLRFVVHAHGWLHTMVPHECCILVDVVTEFAREGVLNE